MSVSFAIKLKALALIAVVLVDQSSQIAVIVDIAVITVRYLGEVRVKQQ